MVATLAFYSPAREASKPEETVLYTVNGLKEPIKANLFLKYDGLSETGKARSITEPSNPEILQDLSDVVRVGLVSPKGDLIVRKNKQGEIKTKPFNLKIIKKDAENARFADTRQVAAKSLDDPMTPAMVAKRARNLALIS